MPDHTEPAIRFATLPRAIPATVSPDSSEALGVIWAGHRLLLLLLYVPLVTTLVPVVVEVPAVLLLLPLLPVLLLLLLPLELLLVMLLVLEFDVPVVAVGCLAFDNEAAW